MDKSEKLLKEIGFVEFVHLNIEQRDNKRRLTWINVINDEIITIRIVLIKNEWQIDYVSPSKYSEKFTSINDVIKFIKS